MMSASQSDWHSYVRLPGKSGVVSFVRKLQKVAWRLEGWGYRVKSRGTEHL